MHDLLLETKWTRWREQGTAAHMWCFWQVAECFAKVLAFPETEEVEDQCAGGDSSRSRGYAVK